MEELGFVSVIFYWFLLTVLVELDSSKLIGVLFEKKKINWTFAIHNGFLHYLPFFTSREHFRLCR